MREKRARLIVFDLNKLVKCPLPIRKMINAAKVCSLLTCDFGKKTLFGLPKNDPECLKWYFWYEDTIFKYKDDDQELKAESKMYRKIQKRIQWFRVGVILRREKAVKILSKLLGIS